MSYVVVHRELALEVVVDETRKSEGGDKRKPSVEAQEMPLRPRERETHSVRPLTPPNADPCHLRPVTSWNGRVEISLPAAATPMMVETPQPVDNRKGSEAEVVCGPGDITYPCGRPREPGA